MGDIVNIRKARKAAARRKHDVGAAENRLIHGRTKIERMRAVAQTAKSRRDLDAHQIDPREER